MVRLWSILPLVSALDEDSTLLSHQKMQKMHTSVNQSESGWFKWKHCKDARSGAYSKHVKKCVGMGKNKGMYAQLGKRNKGGATRCEDDGMHTIKTVTQCEEALAALGLKADNLEAARDPNYTPRPADSVVGQSGGLRLSSYPNGRPNGCSYHESWPLWNGYMNGIGGTPSKNNYKTAFLHCTSDELCGTGGWDCICATKPDEPVEWCGNRVGFSTSQERDPVEVATEEFCAFFCGDGPMGKVTGGCDTVNPVHWANLKKGNNKARRALCSSQCDPEPKNGICIRSQKTIPVVYQDYCETDAKSKTTSNTQMQRVISDFCTFVCDENPGGSIGETCKHKDGNPDVTEVCAQYCSYKPNYVVGGKVTGACSRNQNSKSLCDPEP